MEEEVWLSREDAAAYLGISPEKVKKLIGRGRFPVRIVKEGTQRRFFIAVSELDRWVSEGRQK